MRRYLFGLLAGAIASVPVLVSAAQAIDAGWTPSSDDGVIALRAFDVFSGHAPLLGQYSQTSPLVGEPVHSLGPLLYWVLALPAHVGGTALVLTMAAISTASIVGSVVIAERRGGRAFAAVTAIAFVLMYRSLPVEVPFEIWNCWAGLYPMVLLLFVAWTVGSGDFRLLPLLVVLASFAAQAHFAYVTPVLAVVVVALIGLRTVPRRWLLAAVLAFVVCWSAPVVEQVGHRPGNMVLVYRLATGDYPTMGANTGWYSTARSVGVVPWWAKRARTPSELVLETVNRPPVFTTVTALLLLGGLAAMLVVGYRRGRRDVVVAAALGVAVSASVGFVTAAAPTGLLGLAAASYVFAWMAPAGMFVWLAAGWCAWALWRPEHRLADLRTPLARCAALGAVAVLSALITDRSDEDTDRLPPGLKDYGLIRATAQRVADDLEGSRGVRIQVPRSVRNSLTFQSAIAYELRREGVPLSVPARLVKEMGSSYSDEDKRYRDVVTIADGNASIGPGERLVVRTPEVTVTRSLR